MIVSPLNAEPSGGAAADRRRRDGPQDKVLGRSLRQRYRPGVKKSRLVPTLFGPLPVQAINRILDLDLEPGDAIMPVNAQKHASRKRPEDYARCFPHVAAVIERPLYARDDFRNEGKIELIGKPAALGEYLLVAVEITRDAQGRYNVTSIYPISEAKVAKRREGRHLKRVYMI